MRLTRTGAECLAAAVTAGFIYGRSLAPIVGAGDSGELSRVLLLAVGGSDRGRSRIRARRAPSMREPSGFALIEVILIVVIAAVAVLPLSMLFANTSIRWGDARNATVAAQLAQTKMEEIAADKSCPTRGFDFLIGANYPPERLVPAFSGYVRSVSIGPDSTYDGVRFRAVSVTVSCTNIAPVTLTTWFTSY